MEAGEARIEFVGGRRPAAGLDGAALSVGQGVGIEAGRTGAFEGVADQQQADRQPLGEPGDQALEIRPRGVEGARDDEVPAGGQQ